MLWLLRVFYNLTGIWGVAIILLTVVVKVVTLPLTFKQMRSMKKMREIQPELEALKKKYADDRVRQAQEMQALFQRAGVNPLAGACRCSSSCRSGSRCTRCSTRPWSCTASRSCGCPI
jgi:YidC/Oxa1 family membrane protein insertase